MRYGYLRMNLDDSDTSVDTREDPEVTQIKENHVSEKNIYVDIQDRKDQYSKLVKKLRSGDVLYLGSLSCLGKSYGEIIDQWKLITDEKGADIAVMDIPLLDTRTGKDTFDSKYVSELVQQLLQFAEDYDDAREQTRRAERHRLQAEGITVAKKKGVHFGKKPRKLPDNFASIVKSQQNKEISGEEAARKCGLPVSTYYYLAKKISNKS